MRTDIQDFKTKGLVGISYPVDARRIVIKCVESWKAFCELPLEIKQSIPYSNTGAGIGYEFKMGDGPSSDRKENFDITLKGVERIRSSTVSSDPVIARFLEDVLLVVGSVSPLIISFAHEVERNIGLEGFAREVWESVDGFFFRFIHYPEGSPVGFEVAQHHADQSGMTPHLFESASGLECLTFDGEWIPMPVSESEMVIIPAMQLQLRSKGELQALSHRVRATKETARTGRYSAVCFVQFTHTPKYDKQKWGRLQEMVAGFNYGMPHEEFQKFFKE